MPAGGTRMLRFPMLIVMNLSMAVRADAALWWPTRRGAWQTAVDHRRRCLAADNGERYGKH